MLKKFVALAFVALLSLAVMPSPADAARTGCKGMVIIDGKSALFTFSAKANARKAWRREVRKRHGYTRSTRWLRSGCRHYHCRFVEPESGTTSSRRKVCQAWAAPRKRT